MLFFHIYLMNLLSCCFSQVKENNTTRILKAVEIQRPVFMLKVLSKHVQNLRSRDQADKCICLANCSLSLPRHLKIYSEVPLVLKIRMQVDGDGDGGRDRLHFSV